MLAMISTSVPLTMTSREIAELIGKTHSNVMRDIRAMMEALEQDSELNSVCKSTTYVASTGQEYPQYELDKDTWLTLLLGYDPVARMRVVKRWQELESGAAHPAAINMRDPKQLVAVAIQLIEVNQELQSTVDTQQKKIEADAPKVEGFDRIAATDGSMCITDAAKTLQVQPRKLFQLQQARSWVYRRPMGSGWLAYQDRIQQGYLEHKVTSGMRSSDGYEWTDTQVRVTPSGAGAVVGVAARVHALLGRDAAVGRRGAAPRTALRVVPVLVGRVADGVA